MKDERYFIGRIPEKNRKLRNLALRAELVLDKFLEKTVFLMDFKGVRNFLSENFVKIVFSFGFRNPTLKVFLKKIFFNKLSCKRDLTYLFAIVLIALKYYNFI